ncbi:hypothetical protein Dsin_028188 [Dipteronia sinensis]|uniref:Uncharacterized protein n=1 Tax=Dipteronia sinensis TaxID=43782 RepID=A0AAD9ZQD1_9ROSI|nr:hypothetical protein Dsin_028188 [Dipteronia sinensis]
MANMIRCLRRSHQQLLSKSIIFNTSPVTKFGSFTVCKNDEVGDVTLTREFGGNEDIKIEVYNYNGDLIGPTINISKKCDDGEKLEIDGLFNTPPSPSIKITGLWVLQNDNTDTSSYYIGRKFRRGINGQLGEFLKKYFMSNEIFKLIRSMESLESFMEKK